MILTIDNDNQVTKPFTGKTIHVGVGDLQVRITAAELRNAVRRKLIGGNRQVVLTIEEPVRDCYYVKGARAYNKV